MICLYLYLEIMIHSFSHAPTYTNQPLKQGEWTVKYILSSTTYHNYSILYVKITIRYPILILASQSRQKLVKTSVNISENIILRQQQNILVSYLLTWLSKRLYVEKILFNAAYGLSHSKKIKCSKDLSSWIISDTRIKWS